MTDPAQDDRPPRGPYPAASTTKWSASPVHPLPAGPGGRPGYLVTGYPEARAALNDRRLSKDTAVFFAGKESGRRLHPAVAHTMLATDPPHHTRLRKLVTAAFTTGAVEGLRPFIAQVTHKLLNECPADEPFDFMASVAVPLPVTVICELLGVPETDRADVRRWSAELFAAEESDTIDTASHHIANYMTSLVTAKRRSPGTALLDRLIAVRDGGDHLSETELVSLAVLLLVAGHETTASTLGNALLALLQHPAELRRLRDDPDRIPAALDELIRFDSAVSTATFRFTTETITLGGTEIPSGMPVLLAIGAANRDPRRFSEPDLLDLDRNAAGHLGFGHGIHRCLGASLARAEAEIALRAVLTRFPRIRLAVPAEHLHWKHTRLVRGLASLPVLT
ncbi:cytochrome P450 [Streptomyces sp. NPDC055992]|uniref:cytochrome P450 family protein n=1 Tax=Streptomyces sp. NPDC055992 TaxID=3345673 RepID=UPI0035DA2354